MKILLVVIPFVPSLLAQTLPEGPGKATVQRMCKPCHGLENVVRARRTREAWSDIVDDMVARGAKGTDSDADEVVEYLATHFGPEAGRKVNVNKAAAPELTSIVGISAADAETIKSIRDLMKVPGIDAKKIESNRDRIEF